MKRKACAIFLAFLALTASAYGQAAATVYDPTLATRTRFVSVSVEEAVDKAADAAAKFVAGKPCEPEVEIVGTAAGAFTRAKASQTLVFYQYCRTGNGFGWAGLVLVEGGKVAGNYIADAGWTVGIGRVADINRDGLDEFVVAYSGGMHQGQGGIGVDLMEFRNGEPSGIGWYKAEEYGPGETSHVWKLTARPGEVPVFYTQKYRTDDEGRFKMTGKPATAKLEKPYSKFTAVK